LSTYTSEPGKSDVDASLLCLAIAGFLPRRQRPHAVTYRRICARLDAETADCIESPANGIPVEGAFGNHAPLLAVQFLALGRAAARWRKAEAAFARCAVGPTFPAREENRSRSGRVLGNRASGFTHMFDQRRLAIEERRQQESTA